MIVKFKTKVLLFGFGICALLLLSQLCFVIKPLYAKELTILYTGSTHAMIYPCSCPFEPDGGISRRSTLINELRKKNPDTLLLDAGAFFAGGLFDEYTQNTELDSKRTAVNLKAMELMKYDAVNVSDNEFNFGRKFAEDSLSNTKIPFLSSNIKSDKLQPYIIKDVAGLKIGIIGVSPNFSAQKADGLKLISPEAAIKNSIAELKKNNTDIIVLLSSLGLEQDFDFINNIKGIDVVIESISNKQLRSINKIGSAIIVSASWQGKKLGKLSLIIEDKKITNHNIEEIRLSDKVKDDQAILSILPQCFSDSNCKKSNSLGVCQNPGDRLARCVFSEAPKVNLFVITSKQCRVCNPESLVGYLKKDFPGIVVSYLYHPDKATDKFIKDFKIKALPAFLFGREIEKNSSFDNFKRNLELQGNYYILKAEYSGISYFLERNIEKGKLDLFISLYQKDAKELLDLAKDYNPEVHFLAAENERGFDAAKGNLETEEYLRSVCVKKYYPDKFWDYITCRAKNNNSSWWQDCLATEDTDKIKNCAQAEEGSLLLRENISLNRELQVMLGPLFLLDNQEIFGFKSLPTKEQLRKMIKR